MSSYTITKSSLTGFPGGINSAFGDTVIPAVLEYGDAFGITFNFAYAGDDRYIDLSIEYLGVTKGFDDLSVSQAGNKSIRITGAARDVFLDQYYEFAMDPERNITKILPPDTTEKFATIVRYNPPAVFRVARNHAVSLRITYTPNPNYGAEAAVPGDPNAVPPIPDKPAVPPSPLPPLVINTTVNFSQDVVWWYDRAVQRFQAILAKGYI